MDTERYPQNADAELSYKTIFKNHVGLSKLDSKAIEDIIAWRAPPSFYKPGRSAWYLLQQPLTLDSGVTVHAAKLKGAGGWNPSVDSNLSGLSQPSNLEYTATGRRAHFGINTDGEFCTTYSDPAPFGAIAHNRARLEFDNATRLQAAAVPSIIPYQLIDYTDLDGFRGEPLSVAVSLVPTELPTRLESLLLGDGHLNEAEKKATQTIIKYYTPSNVSHPGMTQARPWVAREIGQLVRRLNACGLYRHSSAWDNFMFDSQSECLFLTDLDSTRLLEDLAPELRGLQQFRDFASALYRLANSLYKPFVIKSHSFSELRQYDPFAGIISGYFDLSLDEAKPYTDSLWRYFGSHWFLILGVCDRLTQFPLEQRKSYRMVSNVFYCLAMWSLRSVYQSRQKHLELEGIPDDKELERRIALYLGESFELFKLLR